MNYTLDKYLEGFHYTRKDFSIVVPGFPNNGVCQLTIVKRGEEGLVIISEYPDNSGKSITNACEFLIPDIIEKESLNPDKTVFIEHYDGSYGVGTGEGDTFSRIVNYVQPAWEHISHDNFKSLIKAYASEN